MSTVPLTVVPLDRTIATSAGQTILEACRTADVDLAGICGGRGRCRECRVRLLDGVVPFTRTEIELLSEEERASGWRLACQVRVHQPMVVELPPVPLKLLDPKVVEPQLAGDEPPVLTDILVEVDPAVDEGETHRQLLWQALTAMGICPRRGSLRALQQLGLLRAAGYQTLRCLIVEDQLVDVRPPSDRAVYALAMDLGTTTISVALLDLTNRSMLHVLTERNPQGAYGADIIARIAHASQGPEQLQELHRKLIAAVNKTIEHLVRSYDLPREDILLVTAAGNSVIHHLFFGLDVETLGGFPFTPVEGELLITSAAELGLRLTPHCPVIGLPIISGYVGGDAVGVIVALNLLERTRPALAVDLGTNTEIALTVDGQLFVASAPAGPAFEGGQMACGMQARPGAISQVTIDPPARRVQIATVEDKPPQGITGTGIIDTIAELCRIGLIDPTGRFADPIDWPEWLRDRALTIGDQRAFLVARTPDDRPIYLSQGDVRELQLAKGATASGIHFLLDEAGVQPADLDAVYVAGAFGSYLNPTNARLLGLLPNIPAERIHFVGNAALAGVVLAAFSRRHLALAQTVRRQARRLDLALRPDFQDVFVRVLDFPLSGQPR